MRSADHILIFFAFFIGALLASLYVCSEFIEIGASPGNGTSTIVVSFESSSRSLITVQFVVRRSNQHLLLWAIPVAAIVVLTVMQLVLLCGAFAALRVWQSNRKRTSG